VLTNLLSNSVKFTNLGSVDVHVELVSTEEVAPPTPPASSSSLTKSGRFAKGKPVDTRPKARRGSADTAPRKMGGSRDEIEVVDEEAIRAEYVSKQRRRNSLPWNSNKKVNNLRRMGMSSIGSSSGNLLAIGPDSCYDGDVDEEEQPSPVYVALSHPDSRVVRMRECVCGGACACVCVLKLALLCWHVQALAQDQGYRHGHRHQ
jgi:hypothetical protein